MTISKSSVIIAALVLVIGALCFALNSLNNQKNAAYEEGYKNGSYTVVKADETIQQLKKENKELYDSIKNIKDKVTFVTQFKYKKVYVVDTVYIKPIQPNDTIKTFAYSNANQNDSLNYNLSIGSTREPNWYKLDISVGDKFTIINKKDGDINSTIINSGNNGVIEDVTVFNKKQKHFWDRFGAGPQFGFGYGLVKKEFDFYVGIGVTYDLK